MQGKKRRNLAKAGRPLSEDSAKSIIGKKLRAIQGRKKNAEICGNMGVAESTFRNYLSGESVPDARALASLAAETGVDLNWLLDDSQEVPADGQPVLRESGGIVSAPLVSELQAEINKLKERNETLNDALVSMRKERDEAIDAARTAGRKEANGA